MSLSDYSMLDSFLVRIFFLFGLICLPGVIYSQFIFSTEASFIDKLTISPLPVYSILKAKYRLYCFFAMIVAILFLPGILLEVKVIEILSAFLFAIGFMYFVGFQCARFNYKRLDIKATKYYNWQGFTWNQQAISLLALFVPGGIIFLINHFGGENTTLLIMAVIGLGFIVTNKFWLISLSRNFEKTRYRRLECYREK
jgi:hypothetical protein